MKPKISVIIAIDNEGKFLEKCLNSLVNQTLKEIEILCIDNGTENECKEICNKFKQQDERVSFIGMKKGRFAFAKYVGLKIARGEFIAFVDANDWVRENYLEEMYCFCSEKKADIGICNILKERNYYIEPEAKYTFEKVRFGIATLKEGFKDVYYNFSFKGKIFSAKLLKGIKVTDGSINEDFLAGYLLLKKGRKSFYKNYGGYIENKTINGEFEKIKLPTEKIATILEGLNSWDMIIDDIKSDNEDEGILKECIGAYSRFIVNSIIDISENVDTDTKLFYLKEINEKAIEHKSDIRKYSRVSKSERFVLNIFLLDYRLMILQNLLSKKV